VSSSRVNFAASMLALLSSLLMAAPLHAADAIQVRSASVAVHGDVLEFNARAEFAADEDMRDALAAGATVDLVLEVSVDRKIRYWLDENVLQNELRRELTWNAPSQRFVLRDVDSVRQQTFAELDEALAAAGTVENWQVKLDAPLDPDETYQIGVRARLRRGRMPNALRALTFWTRYWNRSEWYTWVLAR
jgi:hypothetical protein